MEKKSVVILIHNQFQDMEGVYPYYRLKEEGFDVAFAAPKKEIYRGKYGYSVTADMTYAEVDTDKMDAIVIPGGWAPDFMRLDKEALRIVREMNEKNKIIAAICHAGWVLSSAGVLSGRKVTSYVAIKDDVVHAGAEWVDEPVVIDGNLITSRTPDDLPVFVKSLIESLKSS
ncbi:type 1 glutamine amidotransferase [Candidatus Woesearchaeota archaeon]|nr:MAG: type 1 glutamine amidotransferase [Candidatus Woesearchaeota archaeon]